MKTILSDVYSRIQRLKQLELQRSRPFSSIYEQVESQLEFLMDLNILDFEEALPAEFDLYISQIKNSIKLIITHTLGFAPKDVSIFGAQPLATEDYTQHIQIQIDKNPDLDALYKFYNMPEAKIKNEIVKAYKRFSLTVADYAVSVVEDFDHAIGLLKKLVIDAAKPENDLEIPAYDQAKISRILKRLMNLYVFTHTGDTDKHLLQTYESQFASLLADAKSLSESREVPMFLRALMSQFTKFLAANKYGPFFNAYLQQDVFIPEFDGDKALQQFYITYVKGLGVRKWHEANYKYFVKLLNNKNNLESGILAYLSEAGDIYGYFSQLELAKTFERYNATLTDIFARDSNNAADLSDMVEIIKELNALLKSDNTALKKGDASARALIPLLIKQLQTIKIQRESKYLLLSEKDRAFININYITSDRDAKLWSEDGLMYNYFSNNKAIAQYVKDKYESYRQLKETQETTDAERKALATKAEDLTKRFTSDTAHLPKKGPFVSELTLQSELERLRSTLERADRIIKFVKDYMGILKAGPDKKIAPEDFDLPTKLPFETVMKICNQEFNLQILTVKKDTSDFENTERALDDMSLNFTETQLQALQRKLILSYRPAIETPKLTIEKLIPQLEQLKVMKSQVDKKDEILQVMQKEILQKEKELKELSIVGEDTSAQVGSDFGFLKEFVTRRQQNTAQDKVYENILAGFFKDNAYISAQQGESLTAVTKIKDMEPVINALRALTSNSETLAIEEQRIKGSEQTSETSENFNKALEVRRDCLEKAAACSFVGESKVGKEIATLINKSAAQELASVQGYEQGFQSKYPPASYMRGKQLNLLAKFLGVPVTSTSSIQTVLDSLLLKQNAALPLYKKELVSLLQNFLLEKIDETRFFALLDVYTLKQAPETGWFGLKKLRSYFNADSETRTKYWNLSALEEFVIEFREQYAGNRDKYLTNLVKTDRDRAIAFLRECNSHIKELQREIKKPDVKLEPQKQTDKKKSHKVVEAISQSGLWTNRGVIKRKLIRNTARVELDIAAEKQKDEEKQKGADPAAPANPAKGGRAH